MNNFSEFVETKKFKKILIGVLGLLVLFLVFSLGLFVGFEKARFSFHWRENYMNNFAGRPDPFFNRDFVNPHGIFGEIISIDKNNIIINGPNNTEVKILTDEKTVIKKNDDDLKSSDLKTGDNLVIIGAPGNEGQIQAKFIRVVPPAPDTNEN
jgi:hypothetical protein